MSVEFPVGGQNPFSNNILEPFVDVPLGEVAGTGAAVEAGAAEAGAAEGGVMSVLASAARAVPSIAARVGPLIRAARPLLGPAGVLAGVLTVASTAVSA